MVELKNVNVHYSSGVDALQNINLRINDGEFVFIVGGSGAGKSTLVKLMTREIVPTEGRVFVNCYNLSKTKGNKIAKFRRSIGMVFQDFRLLPDRNVFENIAFAQQVIEAPTRQVKSRVLSMLSMVGLLDKYKAYPNELSGGEQQMLTVARGLMQNPTMILLDEITEGLAPIVVDQLAEIVSQLRKMNVSILVAEQSVKFALAVSDDCYILEKGNVVLHKPTAELTHEEILKYLGT